MALKNIRTDSMSSTLFCPLCAKKGKETKVLPFALNLKESIYLCSSVKCTYPFGEHILSVTTSLPYQEQAAINKEIFKENEGIEISDIISSVKETQKNYDDNNFTDFILGEINHFENEALKGNTPSTNKFSVDETCWNSQDSLESNVNVNNVFDVSQNSDIPLDASEIKTSIISNQQLNSSHSEDVFLPTMTSKSFEICLLDSEPDKISATEDPMNFGINPTSSNISLRAVSKFIKMPPTVSEITSNVGCVDLKIDSMTFKANHEIPNTAIKICPMRNSVTPSIDQTISEINETDGNVDPLNQEILTLETNLNSTKMNECDKIIVTSPKHVENEIILDSKSSLEEVSHIPINTNTTIVTKFSPNGEPDFLNTITEEYVLNFSEDLAPSAKSLLMSGNFILPKHPKEGNLIKDKKNQEERFTENKLRDQQRTQKKEHLTQIQNKEFLKDHQVTKEINVAAMNIKAKSGYEKSIKSDSDLEMATPEVRHVPERKNKLAELNLKLLSMSQRHTIVKRKNLSRATSIT